MTSWRLYLAGTCSWRTGIRHNHMDRQRMPCWWPVNIVCCRHTPRSANAARLFHTYCHKERGNAERPPCHSARTAPSRTRAGHQLVHMTVRAWCWSRRSDVVTPADQLQHSHQLLITSLNYKHITDGDYWSCTEPFPAPLSAHWHWCITRGPIYKKILGQT